MLIFLDDMVFGVGNLKNFSRAAPQSGERRNGRNGYVTVALGALAALRATIIHYSLFGLWP